MTLAATITALRTAIDTIPNLRVYTDPPESINEFPAALVYSASGDMQFGSAGLARNYHTLNVDIYHSMQRLAQAVSDAQAWPPLVYDAIETAYNAGDIDVVSSNGRAAISYQMRPLPYNNNVHFGVRFTVRLKEVVAS